MDIAKSNIVKAIAGRDKGKLFFVLAVNENCPPPAVTGITAAGSVSVNLYFLHILKGNLFSRTEAFFASVRELFVNYSASSALKL